MFSRKEKVAGRKEKAFAKCKKDILFGLAGDVWGPDDGVRAGSTKQKGRKSDKTVGWEEDADTDDENEAELMARSIETSKRAIVLVTRQTKLAIAKFMFMGLLKSILISLPFAVLKVILYVLHKDEHVIEILDIDIFYLALSVSVLVCFYYFLHFVMMIILEASRRHYERHKRMFFIAKNMWDRAIGLVVISALHLVYYNNKIHIIKMSEKAGNLVETILYCAIGFQIIFLIADWLGVSIAAKDSIICQGICKILIDYIQGIDTTREQASQAPRFYVRLLDGFPLFYRPIYISGVYVISKALNDFIDTATRGDALHQSIVGQKDAVRERLGDNDGKKVKVDMTMAIHYIYDKLLLMGEDAFRLPNPNAMSSGVITSGPSPSVSTTIDCDNPHEFSGSASTVSSLDDSVSVSGYDTDSCSHLGPGENPDSVLQFKHFQHFMYKRLALKLLQSIMGDISLSHISKDNFTYWFQEIIKSRKLQGVTVSDMDGMLTLLLNVIYVAAWIVTFIYVFAHISKDYQGALLSLSTFILGFSFMFGSSAGVLFDSCIFIMATHPYDVGDRVLCLGDDGVEQDIEVLKVNLLTTEFLRWDGQLYVVHNSQMLKRDIRNMKRSPFSCHLLYVTLPPQTDFETILALKKRMNDFRNIRRDLKLKEVAACVRDLTRDGIRILIYVEQRVSFQDYDLRYRILSACEEEIILACRDLDIDVTSGVAVQPVDLLSNPQRHLRDSTPAYTDNSGDLFASNFNVTT